MRAAGWDVDHGTSMPAKWELRGKDRHPCYEIIYSFPGQTMFLRVDPSTSETVQITGQSGRGPSPTSDTAQLTSDWALQKLLSLNPYKIGRGVVHMGNPTIRYYPNDCQYVITFPRTDAAGHEFEATAAGFDYDHGAARVTGLVLGVDLPEPSVTTGTMLSEQQATSIALQFLLANKSRAFKLVPEKMTFVYVPESTMLRVVERDGYFGGPTTGTAVAYKILRFESRLTDPSYTGRYEKETVLVCVDVFSGALVAGGMTKMFAGGH